jgi:lipopolysaccharide transport system ATP-binding protein
MSFIEANNLEVSFPIYGTSSRSLKKVTLRALTGGALGVDSNDTVTIKALDNLTFSWKSGDRVGLVGHNGSGKTTLLRALAGIYAPTSGSLQINGTVVSMLSVTLGMEADATGMENIHLRGTLMGYTKKQISNLADEVIEFSDLGDYIYMPMRTYSSGMMMRLAFGISTSVTADILLMDEWLSVGDEQFAEKAEKRLKLLVDRAKILVIASHNPGLIKSLCNKAIHLENGKIKNANAL